MILIALSRVVICAYPMGYQLIRGVTIHRHGISPGALEANRMGTSYLQSNKRKLSLPTSCEAR